MLQKWKHPETARQQHGPYGAAATSDTLPAELRSRLWAELRAQLQALRTACRAGDRPAMRDHAHQLQGMADYFRVAAFRAGFDSLRQALAEGSQPDILAAADDLEALLPGVESGPG